MTENKRIFFNVLATYGRSLFSLACGLFTARWVLNALGEVDYGLYGVVGGLVVFIAFINNTLAGACGRFYAIAIGSARISKNKDLALEESRRWFNTALSLHTVAPVVLLMIGYPLGIWAIQSFLSIPPVRLEACLWVFRLSCLACFVGMINVPFTAMYTAKQYIAELTVYNYISTVVNACFSFYMITHPGDWLVGYAVCTCVVSVLPQIAICWRAIHIFPECRVTVRYLFDMKRLIKVGSFAGWNLLGTMCGVLRSQGVGVLVNKAFGPGVNAAMSIGNSVNAQAATLSSALLGAFQPAIVTAYGEENVKKMKNFSIRASKFGGVLLLVFLIPLMAELPSVLRIWLKNPPAYAAFLCAVILWMNFMDVISQGHVSVINASGRVKEYQMKMTLLSIFTLPFAIAVVLMGGGVYGLGAVLIFMRILIVGSRVCLAKTLVGLSVRYWIREVVGPLSALIFIAGIAAILPRLFLPLGLVRIIFAGGFSFTLIMLVSWPLVLNDQERFYLREKVCAKLSRFF